MPIYEYRCEHCGHEMEALQKLSDAALIDCPACGQASLKKLISAAGFRLKGGGWYETDFKSSGRRNLAGDSDSSSSSPGSSKESSASSTTPSASTSTTTPSKPSGGSGDKAA
jgi:putative FmdB family regulatory protein